MYSKVIASRLLIAGIAGLASVALPAESPALAQGSESASLAPAADNGWPRQFETPTHLVRVHHPQVDEWPDFDRIKFRAAVVVESKGSSEMKFGILVVSARADVAIEERLVLLTDRRFEEILFPDTDPAEAKTLAEIVKDAIPEGKAQTVSLDRIIAKLDVNESAVRKVPVNLEPPKIFASDTPAVMVAFVGKPRFKAAPDRKSVV